MAQSISSPRHAAKGPRPFSHRKQEPTFLSTHMPSTMQGLYVGWGSWSAFKALWLPGNTYAWSSALLDLPPFMALSQDPPVLAQAKVFPCGPLTHCTEEAASNYSRLTTNDISRWWGKGPECLNSGWFWTCWTLRRGSAHPRFVSRDNVQMPRDPAPRGT